MTEAGPRPRGAHLVGSVPLDSAEDVFRTVGAALGDRLPRVPDGETGPRSIFVGWQRDVFFEHPQLESVEPEPGAFPSRARTRPAPGVDPDGITFEHLGYADEAVQSYQSFERLKEEGVVPAHCRFEVALPAPLSTISMFVVPEWQAALERPYEDRMLAELGQVLAAIPHDQLAVQWDVCAEVWMWEGWIDNPYGDDRQPIIDHVARVTEAVPADVEVGHHLCYGDWNHSHLREPTDAGVLVEMANGIAAGVERPIEWIHMPVPIERDDAAFFAPFADLRLHPETEIYLGLVHHRDGVEGAQRRIAAAAEVVPTFGVATECGMGRRPPERGGRADTLDELLAIHAAISDPVA